MLPIYVHGVPYTTLYDRIFGRICQGANPGPKPYLFKCKEKVVIMSDILTKVSKGGCQQVKSLAGNAIQEKNLTAKYLWKRS